MQQTVHNPQKGRLETINVNFTAENTSWFDDCEDSHGIFSITNLQAGILIKETDYTYPLYVYDVFTSGYRSLSRQSKSIISIIHRQVKAIVITKTPPR